MTDFIMNFEISEVQGGHVLHSDIELCPIILLVPLHALFPVSSLCV